MTFRGLRMWAIAELDLLRLRGLFRAFIPLSSGGGRPGTLSQGEGAETSPLRPPSPQPEKAAAE